MSHAVITKADLAQFTGSARWFRHGLVPSVLYTEGAQFLAENAGAYWLLDEIAFAQAVAAVRVEIFQFWKLSVGPDRSAVLSCDDGNGVLVFTKQIEFTDFLFDTFSLYCADNIILLPSEY